MNRQRQSATNAPKLMRQAFKSIRLAVMALLCCLSAMPAQAATGNVIFQGNVNSTSSCTVIVDQHGDLGVSANLRQLSSKIAGGRAGKVRILQTGTYDISAAAPNFFSSGPAGADTGVTRTVTMLGSAVNLITGFTVTIPERPGAPGFRVLSGSQPSRVNLDIHYVADRTTNYPTGYYKSIVTVRCE